MFSYRLAGLADINQLVEIEKQFEIHLRKLRLSFQEQIKKGHIQVACPKDSNYLAVGYSCVHETQHRKTKQFRLDSIAVLPSCWGEGVGRHLLRLSIKWCRENKADYLLLEVDERNTKAFKLYESEGFLVYGVKPHFYSVGKDAILMRKEL